MINFPIRSVFPEASGGQRDAMPTRPRTHPKSVFISQNILKISTKYPTRDIYHLQSTIVNQRSRWYGTPSVARIEMVGLGSSLVNGIR